MIYGVALADRPQKEPNPKQTSAPWCVLEHAAPHASEEAKEEEDVAGLVWDQPKIRTVCHSAESGLDTRPVTSSYQGGGAGLTAPCHILLSIAGSIQSAAVSTHTAANLPG